MPRRDNHTEVSMEIRKGMGGFVLSVIYIVLFERWCQCVEASATAYSGELLFAKLIYSYSMG